MKIGVLGTGGIVKAVKDAWHKLENVECYAIASRTLERAKEAAKEYRFEKAYGSYEELVADPEVGLVYIATPHSRHYEDMKLCIAHKKPVLCEKAFTLNAKQAREIKELANREGVFVAEAIWTRYMPSRKIIQDTIDSGVIGKISTLSANLSYPIAYKDRIVKPELAGGALLDIGVYGLNFAFMHFGKDIERMESSVMLAETGVDAMENITIFYKDGRMAVLHHDIFSRSDRMGIFSGEKGYIVVDNINNPQHIFVYDTDDNLIKNIPVPEQMNGYEYEFAECIKRIEQGEIESISMPLNESIYVMEQMDALRSKWGVVYPQENDV